MEYLKAKIIGGKRQDMIASSSKDNVYSFKAEIYLESEMKLSFETRVRNCPGSLTIGDWVKIDFSAPMTSDPKILGKLNDRDLAEGTFTYIEKLQ